MNLLFNENCIYMPIKKHLILSNNRLPQFKKAIFIPRS